MAFWSLALAQEDVVEPNKTSVTNSSIAINQSSSSQIWCYGLLSVTVKSFMAVIGLCFLPMMSKSYYNHFLTTMIGLAVGSLTGSALFHLIPAAFELENKLNISLALFGGIYLFFIIEHVLKFLVEYRERSKILESPAEESGSQEPMCSNESNDVETNSEGIYHRLYRILFDSLDQTLYNLQEISLQSEYLLVFMIKTETKFVIGLFNI